MYGDKWTLAELIVDVSDALHDSTNVRWASTDVEKAINQAIRFARQEWREERIDDTNTYSDDDFRYDLPPVCERVVEVWFEPTDDYSPRYQVPATWWRQEGTELVFIRNYPEYDGETMYIVYLVNANNLLDIDLTNGAIATATATALTSVGSTFTTDGVRPGDEVIIYKAAYAGNGTYYVVSVTSETELKLHKAPGTVGTDLTFYVAHYTDMPYGYLVYFSMAWLYEHSARNKPGFDVEEVIRWSAYYRQLADKAMRDMQRAAKGRRRY